LFSRRIFQNIKWNKCQKFDNFFYVASNHGEAFFLKFVAAQSFEGQNRSIFFFAEGSSCEAAGKFCNERGSLLILEAANDSPCWIWGRQKQRRVAFGKDVD